jgi:hypothetical protein
MRENIFKLTGEQFLPSSSTEPYTPEALGQVLTARLRTIEDQEAISDERIAVTVILAYFLSTADV